MTPLRHQTALVIRTKSSNYNFLCKIIIVSIYRFNKYNRIINQSLKTYKLIFYYSKYITNYYHFFRFWNNSWLTKTILILSTCELLSWFQISKICLIKFLQLLYQQIFAGDNIKRRPIRRNRLAINYICLDFQKAKFKLNLPNQ